MGGANSKKRAKRLAEVQERYATESSNIGQGVTTLNKYERHAILGEGTFGRVILYNIDGNPVAVKALKKRAMVDLKQLRHVQDEVKILKQANHPFIVRYFAGFQDTERVYLLLEYIQGGEMFSYLRDEGHFSVPRVRLYSGEILLALRFLHLQQIVYRDLKPENLLVRKDGNVIITDFGFAKKLTASSPRTYTTCGTPDYLAPEIIRAQGHREYVDLWALGVLIFEMATGFPPFYTDKSDMEMYKKIIKGDMGKFPKSIARDKGLTSIVRGLLKVEPSKRLGCAKAGSQVLVDHPFYKTLKWADVFERKVKPDFLPEVGKDPFDTSAFDPYEEDKSVSAPLTDTEELQFAAFDEVF